MVQFIPKVRATHLPAIDVPHNAIFGNMTPIYPTIPPPWIGRIRTNTSAGIETCANEPDKVIGSLSQAFQSTVDAIYAT